MLTICYKQDHLFSHPRTDGPWEHELLGSGTDRVGGGKEDQVCCEALALAGGSALAGGIGQSSGHQGQSPFTK